MKTFVLFLTIIGPLSVLGGQGYAASSLNAVREVLADQGAAPQSAPDRAEWDVYRAGELPRYEVTAASFVENGVNALFNNAERTLTQTEDTYPRIKKLVHPNGICFVGDWVITESTSYTGYFANGRHGLFVGRASVALADTKAGERRGFGFAGKIFPTLNPADVVPTANFFTVDVLMGTYRKHFAETATTNEPKLGFSLSAIWLGIKISRILSKVDGNPGLRPLYPISQLGLPDPESSRTPKWLRIQPDASVAKVDEADFRRELDIKNHPGGIRLNISVSDTTRDAEAKKGWQTIGYIQLKESFVSYGCDRQLHFPHPRLRQVIGH